MPTDVLNAIEDEDEDPEWREHLLRTRAEWISQKRRRGAEPLGPEQPLSGAVPTEGAAASAPRVETPTKAPPAQALKIAKAIQEAKAKLLLKAQNAPPPKRTNTAVLSEARASSREGLKVRRVEVDEGIADARQPVLEVKSEDIGRQPSALQARPTPGQGLPQAPRTVQQLSHPCGGHDGQGRDPTGRHRSPEGCPRRSGRRDGQPDGHRDLGQGERTAHRRGGGRAGIRRRPT